MPSAEDNESNGIASSTTRGGDARSRTRCLSPMVDSGSLNKYTHSDLTPVIGREFHSVQVTDLLDGDKQLIKDLAITGNSLSKFGSFGTVLRTHLIRSFGTRSRLLP